MTLKWAYLGKRNRAHWFIRGASALAALVWTAHGATQQMGGRRAEQAAVLLIAPLAIAVTASLQIAVMSIFPRFSRRCHAAVSRYRWQTTLIGLAAWLACFLLAVVANRIAGGNEQAGLVVLLGGTLFATVGGVGVSLFAGTWALKRATTAETPNPVIAILTGSSVLGWAIILVPCLGQLLYLLVSCLSLGAFLSALVARWRLDEAPAAPSVAPPPGVVAPTASPEEPCRPEAPLPPAGDDYQVF